MNPTKRLGAALVAAVALSSCSTDLEPLAPGARVTCSGDRDCPSGFFCSAALGNLCAPRGGDDQTAPGIVAGSASITPASASAGTLVTVSFEASEDLALDPEVRFQGESAVLGTPGRQGRVHTVQFPAVTAMGTGTRTIVARLVDLSGNVAETVPVGALTLDFTPPEAAPPAIAPAFARAGAVLTAAFTFTEPLGEAPSLRIGSAAGPALTAAEGPGANAWTFARTLDGTEPPGPVDLLLAARDAAGNVLEKRYTDATVLDFTAPTVTGGDIGTPSVRAGDTFVASLEFGEPLGGPPEVELVPAGGGAGIPVTVSALDAAHYALSLDVSPATPDGAFTLTLVSARDRAGNPASPGSLGPVSVDSTPPAVQALATDHANRLYRAGQGVIATFTLSEDVPASPAARLEAAGGALDMPCTAGAGRSYTCTSAPLGEALVEGSASVSVSVVDAAGNARLASTAIALDFTAPELASPPASRYLGTAATRGVEVRAVGRNSSWELAILSSERLAAAPEVVARPPGVGVTVGLVLQSSNAPINTSFTYVLPASPTAHPAASWPVTWTPVDLAGNQPAAPVQIATVEVDGVVPAAPAPGTADAPAIVWTRTPWGTDTSTAAVFEVSATAAAVGADAQVLIAWDGSTASAREVARAAVNGGGGFTVPLGADPGDLWVSTLDHAGNESPRTRVVDVVWTAGLAGKVAGSAFENPHRLETRTRSLGALDQLDAVQASFAAVGLRGDANVVTTSAASVYRPVGGLSDPGPRGGYVLGADPGRGVVVLYGGQVPNSTFPGDTWEWNGTAWRQIPTADPEGDGNPPTTSMTALTYDPVRGGVVGVANGGVWLWNGASWRKLATPPVASGYVAWDARRAVLVFYSAFGTTHEWTGTAWRSPAPLASPPSRAFTTLYFDTEVEQVCLYGGRTSFNSEFADLWCFDGLTWTEHPVSGAGPGLRSEFAAAWDANRRELFLQGGRPISQGSGDGRTYVLRRVNGAATWFDVTSQVLGFTQHAATYDPASGRVVMLGNLDPSLYAFRAWTGSAFTPLAPGDPEGDGNPAVQFRGSNPVYVPARNRTVFPQAGASAAELQTWEWDRASWALRATGGGPQAQGGMTVGWYGSNVIAFGGYVNNVARRDTWSWNGTSWTQLEANPGRAGATTNDPSFRTDAGAATDPATGRLYRVGGHDVVFSGQPISTCYLDVWEWTGAAWVQRADTSWADPEGDGNPASAFLVYPPCRTREYTIWSPAANTLLVYHPETAAIWEWRPATDSWLRHAMTGLAPQTVQGFFWDTTLGAPVVVDYKGPYVADLDRDVYTRASVANPFGPTPPTNATMTFDTGAGEAVAIEALPWVWQSPATAGPAHLFTVDFGRAGGPDPSGCVAGAACPIQRIEVRWTGGASAPTGDGAVLQAWTGGWRDIALTNATAPSPALVGYAWTPASSIPGAALFRGGARELTFALVPGGASSAAGAAQVATDAVSITIRYRRP